MKKEIIISGFGGQGILSIGKTMIEAGVKDGLEVTWVPSYGTEMRGGTARCSVVLSDKKIGSPVFNKPSELIAMNKPSLLKFEASVVPGGTILVNSSIIEEKVTRTDVNAYYVPCVEIASELGNGKVANMVMLGAFIQATKSLKMETIQRMLEHMFTGPKASLVAINMEALKRGSACIG